MSCGFDMKSNWWCAFFFCTQQLIIGYRKDKQVDNKVEDVFEIWLEQVFDQEHPPQAAAIFVAKLKVENDLHMPPLWENIIILMTCSRLQSWFEPVDWPLCGHDRSQWFVLWPRNNVKYRKVLGQLTRTIESKVIRRAWRIHQQAKTFFETIQAMDDGLVYLCIETWAWPNMFNSTLEISFQLCALEDFDIFVT